jgi:hypothetical protein
MIVRVVTQRPPGSSTIPAVVERGTLPSGEDLVAVGFETPFEFRRLVVHVQQDEFENRLAGTTHEQSPVNTDSRTSDAGRSRLKSTDRCVVDGRGRKRTSLTCGGEVLATIKGELEPFRVADRLFPFIHERELSQLMAGAANDRDIFEAIDAKTGVGLADETIEAGHPVRWKIRPPSDSCVLIANIGRTRVKGDDVLNLRILHGKDVVWPAGVESIIPTMETSEGEAIDQGIDTPQQETTLAFFAPTQEAAVSVRFQLEELHERFQAWKTRQEDSAARASVVAPPGPKPAAPQDEDRIRIYKAKWRVVERGAPQQSVVAP